VTSARLAGKVAVVTGAGSVGDGWGNGRATAVVFAREGASVLAVDRDPDALAATLSLVAEHGGTARGHIADVTDSAQVEAMLAVAVDAFGGLDVLVNNVGGSRPGGPAELAEGDWRAQLDVNLTSVYLGCRHAIPVLRERGGGSIVNISSELALTGSETMPHYCAAKGAIVGLTKALALELAPQVRVNSVAPGPTDTPLLGDLWRGEEYLRTLPVPRLATPREIGETVAFLASDEAAYITAQVVSPNSGTVM
jgi:NAD(P)-dependent dehydrogenase (short-subunit alcohol dehydrogenase family)